MGDGKIFGMATAGQEEPTLVRPPASHNRHHHHNRHHVDINVHHHV
jgi:hypothetical protein